MFKTFKLKGMTFSQKTVYAEILEALNNIKVQ